MSPVEKKLIVIGGGAMGVSLLYHLAKLGWQELLLIEKNELTAGSTWHAAGLCTHFAHSPTIMQMRAYSAKLYGGELSRDTGEPVSFHRCGALRITREPDRMDEFRQVQGLGKFLGYPFEVFSAERLAELYPLAQVGDGLLGGIYEPWDGYVDPTQATYAMAAGARARGAKIMRHTRVTATEQLSDGRWSVVTDQGEFICQHLVNAAGTWCYEIGQMMGVDLPVVPMLHQYLVTDQLPEVAALERELPMIRDREESWYLRQEGKGLIFGCYEKAGIPWSIDSVPAEFGMELLPEDMDAMLPFMELAMQRVPMLAHAGIKTIVNGPITFTPDAAPLIGPAYGLDNAWLLTGSSMGVMEGGGAGHFLAHWLHHGAPPYEAHPVDSRRYGSYADREFRVSKAIECFGRQFALHYPGEQLPAARDQRLSELHQHWLEMGAVMGEAYGWERPEYFSSQPDSRQLEPSFQFDNSFSEVARECQMASESLVYADFSLFSKFQLKGPDAIEVLSKLTANRPPQRDGRIALCHLLNSDGGIAMEFTVTRLNEQHFYLTAAAAAERIAEQLLEKACRGLQVQLDSVTDNTGILAVFGPRAVTLLQQLTTSDLSQAAFPWLSAQPLNMAGLSITALRMSYIGEAGFELHLARTDMPRLLLALQQKLQDIPHCPIGMRAVNAMRLEKGYPAWGMDLTSERTPLESGLAPFVKHQQRDFPGRSAMLERQQQDPWQLQLLAIEGAPGPAFGGQPIFAGEQIVGITSSGAYGHRSGNNLAFGYFRQSPGNSPLSLLLLGQRYPVQLLPQAPYDSSNRRLTA